MNDESRNRMIMNEKKVIYLLAAIDEWNYHV